MPILIQVIHLSHMCSGKWTRLLSILFSIIFFSCSRDSVIPPYDYFPLELASYKIYDVEQYTYATGQQAKIRKYQRKESTVSSYLDENKNVVYRIEVSTRGNSLENWRLETIYTAQKTSNRALIFVNNTPKIKLILPVRIGLLWDSNELNFMPSEKTHYKEMLENYTIGDVTYKPLVKTQVQDDSTLITKKKNIEMYAHKVGLVYKEDTDYAFCQQNPDCIGKGIVESGYSQIWRLREFGKE
ncbi:MAG: hypothetical protein ACRCVT_14380 [Leadbetterella sp.]